MEIHAMSSIPHNQNKENEVFDFVTNFISEFQIGKFLFQCNEVRKKGSRHDNLSIFGMPALF